MSRAFVQHSLQYLEHASRCTHESLHRLTCSMRREQLDRLPMDTMFEPLRGPLHHVSQSRDIFAIPDDGVFFLDLLGEEVLSAEELRSRYFETLLCTPEDELCHIVWLVLDVHSQACHALLHLTRRERGSAYKQGPARCVQGPRSRGPRTVHDPGGAAPPEEPAARGPPPVPRRICGHPQVRGASGDLTHPTSLHLHVCPPGLSPRRGNRRPHPPTHPGPDPEPAAAEDRLPPGQQHYSQAVRSRSG